MKYIKTFENYDSFKMKDKSPHSKSDLRKISLEYPDAQFKMIINTLSMDYPILRKFDANQDKEGNLVLTLFSSDESMFDLGMNTSMLISLKFEDLGESISLEYNANIKLLEKNIYDDREAELSNRFEDSGTYLLSHDKFGKEISEAFVTISQRINKAISEFNELAPDSDSVINPIDINNPKAMLN